MIAALELLLAVAALTFVCVPAWSFARRRFARCLADYQEADAPFDVDDMPTGLALMRRGSIMQLMYGVRVTDRERFSRLFRGILRGDTIPELTACAWLLIVCNPLIWVSLYFAVSVYVICASATIGPR